MTETQTPVYSPEEARDRETFLALLWALSQPGHWHALPAQWDAFHAIGMALLDLETSFYTLDSMLGQVLSLTGARHLPAEQAAYLFFPHFNPADLTAVAQAQRGTLLFPDRSATLILGIQADAEEHANYALTGAGIERQVLADLRALPSALWDLRVQTRYPLGWDIVLVDSQHQRILGIPRSIRLTPLGQ
jgi:phosphonate C-P lyase system protein PhnH